jgi:single-strand DNA-binding protein
MNVITITGNSTKDIELTYNQNGTAFAKGTIAVKRDYKNQSGEYETDFINFKVIGKISEVIANYVKKGDKFGITGSLQIDVSEKNGVKQYYTNVMVKGFDFPNKSSETKVEKVDKVFKPTINDDPFSGSSKMIDITDDNLPF